MEVILILLEMDLYAPWEVCSEAFYFLGRQKEGKIEVFLSGSCG